mgnify:CR=1 FL=1
MNKRVVRVAEWPTPRGYENGIVAEGPVLYVAGQVGWNAEGKFEHADLPGQFGQTLENVLAVLHAAGASAANVVKMTVYVTDLEAYRSQQREIGRVWRERMGKVFPVMALVGVAGLVEREALVEIETVAHL